MDLGQRILITLFGALVGFAVSQSFNVVKFIRRPKFKVVHFDSGVHSAYSGDPPEVPSEVTLGFYIQNFGKNPERNTRVFMSELRTAHNNEVSLEDGPFEFTELRRPIDVIPGGESVMIVLGKITSEKHELEIPFETKVSDDQLMTIGADTRIKMVFAAKFHILCDDINSFTVIDLKFNLNADHWAQGILSPIKG